MVVLHLNIARVKMCSWDVIVWKGENAIDFVPSSWANSNNTAYKYPCGVSETMRATLVFKCLNITENFIWCAAEVKKASIADLKKAKRLCLKGQETSTIETSSEDEDVGTRTRRPPKRFLDEDTSPPHKKARLSQTQSPTTNDPPRRVFNVPQDKAPVSLNTSQRSEIEYTRNNDNQISREILSQTSSSLASTVTVTDAYSSRSSSVTVAPDDGDIKRYLVDLTFEVHGIAKKLNTLENLIMTKVATSPHSSFQESCDTFDFPITTTEKLNELNQLLDTNQQKMNDLINFFSLIGGDDPHKSVYLILSKLLGKELALEYSGVGKKKKLPFSEQKLICHAITAAIRRKFSGATEQEIKKSVSLYLASAKSRIPK